MGQFGSARRLAAAAMMLALGLLFQVAPASAQDAAARIASPDGRIAVVLQSSGGYATWSVSRDGKPLVLPSRLGFLLADAPKLERNLTLSASTQSRQDSTWEQPWGERRFVRDHYGELTATFTETSPLKRQFTVTVRAHNDGIGFRYGFPEQDNLKTLAIAEELTEFNFAQDGTAWWIPAGEWNRYEYLYNRTPVREVSTAHTPVTLRLADGTHVALHEAALVDYSAMWLRRSTGLEFRAELSPNPHGPKVVRAAPFHTPWRTLQIADNAAGLVNSDLILNLNEPNALGDVSWVRPHKYVGIWWEMHLDTATWGSGPKHGATTAKTRKMIDFAAAHGFRGVLVEGWNTGWDGDWFAGTSGFNFTQSHPDFDLEGLAAYAREKGVRLIGHHETAANVANYGPQMEAAFSLYERLGVDSVKTGYVADAGGARVAGPDGAERFVWHDGQDMVRHHLDVVRLAARHRIAINAHEPVKDTGLRRTYPNWVAREGARGMEYNAWADPENPPEHEANLIFTRLLAGPMDFTPGIFALKPTQPGRQVKTTLAKQLALYVALYSPIQMAADLPQSYEANLPAFQFIKDVPTDWADSRALAGDVGDYAVVARQDRNTEDWYLGAITDENARTVRLKLDFLPPGRAFTAQIYRDGPGAHWDKNPSSLVIETRVVTALDSLTMRLAPGGGQAVRFVAAPAFE